MADEANPVPDNSTESAVPPTPTDFREYVKWRQSGEVPAQEQPPPAAADETPQAKTEPQSGAEGNQQTEEEDETGDSEGEPIGKRGIQRQRRIDRLTGRIEQLERALAANAGSIPPEPQTPPPTANGEPQLANFPTLEAYQKALTYWVLDQREAQRKIEEAENKSRSDWDSKQKAARKLHPDFDDTIASAPIPEGPGIGVLRQACLADEAGAEIAYYLGKHPDDLKRIAALTPLHAATELGKIAARVSIPSSDDADNRNQKVTGAPKPPPSVGRPAKTASDSLTDPEVLRDFSKWERLRRAQLGRK